MTKIVSEESFTIGRSLDCALPLNDESISRVHVVITHRGNQVWIEDKNSSNGTMLNGVRLQAEKPTNIVPSDKIQLGKSLYVVTVSLEIEEVQQPVENHDHDSGVISETLAMIVPEHLQVPEAPKQVMSAPQPVQAAAKIVAEPLVTPVTPAAVVAASTPQAPSNSAFEHERLIHEARKKAAQILYEGEAQAEKRVQSIYQKAQEAQATAQNHAQKVITDAHREADRILTEFQKQGQELIAEARQMAQELREEVQVYTQSQREKVQRETLEKLEEASSQAEALKKETLQSSLDTAEEEAARIVSKAQSEAQGALSFAKMQADELLNNARKDNEKELAILREQIEKSQAEREDLERKAVVLREQFSTLQEKVDGQEKLSHEQEAKNSDLAQKIETLTQEWTEKKEKYEQEFAEKSALFEKESSEKAARFEQEWADKKALFEQESSDKMNRFTSEYAAKTTEIERNYAGREALLEKEFSEKKAATEKEYSEKYASFEKLHSEKKVQYEWLTKENETLTAEHKKLQEQVARMDGERRTMEDKVKAIENEFNVQKSALKDKLEKEVQSATKNNEEQLNSAQLEISKRLQKVEHDLLADIIAKKESLSKDIHTAIEYRVVQVLETKKWNEISEEVLEDVKGAIEGKVISMTSSSASPGKIVSLPKKKKQEQRRWLASGMVMGLLLFFGGEKAYNIVRKDANPMETLVQNEVSERQADLQRRKFNPPQTPELKDSYTDSVIYTSNFVTNYTESQFQTKLYKATSAYLLKTWRIDEDKSIQVLSMASALVKELAEKKEAIHPDYIKAGVDKMHVLEAQTLARMRETLGTEVRLESFRRFERQFYQENSGNRRLANDTTGP